MCFLTDAKRVLSITESKEEPIYEIILADGQTVTMLKEAFDWEEYREDFATIVFYHGKIHGPYWQDIKNFLAQNGITIPYEKTPCAGCSGNRCGWLCQPEHQQAGSKAA